MWKADHEEERRLQGEHPDAPEEVEAQMEKRRAGHSFAAVTVTQVADHVDHVRDVAGIASVGIGGDYDGVPFMPEGLQDVSTYPVLFAELRSRGYSDDELRRIAGRNVLRALRRAEHVAHDLQATRGPSLVRITDSPGLTVTGQSELPPRHVTLVLCTPDGHVLGALPPYDVASPWWQETADVVAGAKALYGVDITVLRLLHVERRGRPATGGRSPTSRRSMSHPAWSSRPGPATRTLTSRCASSGRGQEGRRPTSRGPSGCSPIAGRLSPARPSRCGPGTCPASGGCRRETAQCGSRWCRRSSPTRARCSSGCR